MRDIWTESCCSVDFYSVLLQYPLRTSRLHHILNQQVQDSVSDVIPGTLNISLGTLGFKADSEMGEFADPTLGAAPKDTPIVVTCGLGGQAIVAAKLLLEYGFWQTKVVEGGCMAWKEAGLPMDKVE